MYAFPFCEKLHAECGVPYPAPNEQDWEYCAGEPERTGDYLAFYQKYAAGMDATDKHLLIEMIVQGIEDLMRAKAAAAETESLWAQAKTILLRDCHRQTVEYWSCIGQDLENSWHITAKMRGLLPCFYEAYQRQDPECSLTDPVIAQIRQRYGALCLLCPPLHERDCDETEKKLPAELLAVLRISNGILELAALPDVNDGRPFVSGVILYSFEKMLAETEDFAEICHAEGTAFAGDGAGGFYVRKPDGTVWLYEYPSKKSVYAAESVIAFYAGRQAKS